MYKHKIPLLPQEYLGYHLGLIVPPEGRELFWKVRTGKKPKAGWGTQIEKTQFSPNKVLSKLKVPLEMKLHNAKDFTEESLSSFLKEGQDKNKDLIVCFDNGALANSSKHGGHVCVFDRIDTKTKRVRLIDPSSNQPKWRFVTVKALLKGMSYHWNKSGGVWEFSLKK